MNREFHLPSYEEVVAANERHRREGNQAIPHFIEVNKGSKKNPQWIRHSRYPSRHDAEQAMFRDTLDIPATHKRVTNTDQSTVVMIAIYGDEPKVTNEDD